MSETKRTYANRPTVRSDAVTGELIISWHEENPDSEVYEVDTYEVVFHPNDAIGLAGDVAQQVSYLTLDLIEALDRGNCPTCGNARLVQKPVGSAKQAPRMTSIHCPDCYHERPRREQKYPTVCQPGPERRLTLDE